MRRLATAYPLTLPQHMALTMGPRDGMPFRDDADARLAWAANRDVMLARSGHGRRPAAFWLIDVERPDLDDETEEAAVARHAWLLGHPEHLRPGERRAILGHLRADLDDYLGPGPAYPERTPAEVTRCAALARSIRRVLAMYGGTHGEAADGVRSTP